MCCGRRTVGTESIRTASNPGGASSGPGAGTYTVTTTTGGTVVKHSEIAAKLYVAAHPGSTYTQN
jgi:hypothetical protein